VKGRASFLFPWFWRECRHIHFSRAFRDGVRRANPPRSSRPSSLLRKERARCSESNAAIDESKRALTSSPMRPVRPGGTSTTDSSCPSAVAPSSHRMGPRLGDACLAPLRVERDSANDSFERCHAPDLVTDEYPDDGRSIRPPGIPLTYPRRQTCSANAGSPLSTFFACWTEKVSRGTLRNVLPPRKGKPHCP
jgi:hypothetical protein